MSDLRITVKVPGAAWEAALEEKEKLAMYLEERYGKPVKVIQVEEVDTSSDSHSDGNSISGWKIYKTEGCVYVQVRK